MKHTDNTPAPIVTEAVNLRRDRRQPAILRRAGTPRRVSDTPALPFASFTPYGDGRTVTLLTDHTHNLYYQVADDRVSKVLNVSKDPNDPTDLDPIGVTLVARLPAAPILVVTGGGGVVRVMLAHHRDVYLTYDDDLTLHYHGEMPELPAVRLMATDYNTLYDEIPTLSLSGNSPSTSGSQLTDSDNALLTDALNRSYTRLRKQAEAMGYCVQPILARYRLVDAAGNTVATGPTVPLSAVEGYSATSEVVMLSDDNLATLRGGRLAMQVYRPALLAPETLPAPWNRLIHHLDIEITREISPVDSDSSTPHGIHRDTPSGRVALTAHLPGTGNGTVIDKTRLRRLAIEAMERVSGERFLAARYSFPFDNMLGSAGNIIPLTVRGDLPKVENTAADLIADGNMSRSWSAALADGDVTILCNPRTEIPQGWAPDCFAASRDPESTGEWRIAFAVTLSTPAGQTTVCRESVGNTLAPVSLSPILSFPYEDATSLTVIIRAPDGIPYEERFTLTPITGAGIACYVSPGLERITLTRTAPDYLLPATTCRTRVDNGRADLCLSADPGRCLDSLQISGSEIVAVRHAPRSGSGWDFARRKLLFFSAEGTTLATIDSKHRFHSHAPVDHRPVRSADALCEAADDKGAALLVIAGDDLLRISGQRVTALLTGITGRLGFLPEAVGWEAVHREIWLAPVGRADIVIPPLPCRVSADGEIFTVDVAGLTGPLRFAQCAGVLLAASAGGVMNLSDENTDPSLKVRLRSRHQVTEPPGSITTAVFGKDLTGSITLSGDRGTEISERLLHLAIDGEINSPVTLRLAAPARQWLDILVDFEASADLAIHGYGLNLNLNKVINGLRVSKVLNGHKDLKDPTHLTHIIGYYD